MTVTVSGDGSTSGGLHLIGNAVWTTNTSSVTFNVDITKYELFKLTWWIDHAGAWYETKLRFRTSAGDYTGALYRNTTEWMPSTAASANSNQTIINGDWSVSRSGNTTTGLWLSGNGNEWCSQGSAIIAIPNTGINRPAYRSTAQLIRRNSGDTNNWMEKSGGSCSGLYGNNVTGITIYGSGASRRGQIVLEGARK